MIVMLIWGIKKKDKALETVFKFSPKGIHSLALTLEY